MGRLLVLETRVVVLDSTEDNDQETSDQREEDIEQEAASGLAYMESADAQTYKMRRTYMRDSICKGSHERSLAAEDLILSHCSQQSGEEEALVDSMRRLPLASSEVGDASPGNSKDQAGAGEGSILLQRRHPCPEDIPCRAAWLAERLCSLPLSASPRWWGLTCTALEGLGWMNW